MKVENETFGQERAFYGEKQTELYNCRFEGEEDGESALKECGKVYAKDCYFDLRYPLWHDKQVDLEDCELTENCRAALWYSQNITASNTRFHGIKALRECNNATIRHSDIVSPEFGWSSNNVLLFDTTAASEYFMMRAENFQAERLQLKGKYSFQYVKGAKLEKCKLDTKDAFWHSENVTVSNSIVVGEYLGWYSKNLTFINCTIIGTQPLCYCKNLKLVDCIMHKTDLCFEKSEVNAVLRSVVDSIKNPCKGVIRVPKVGEIIRDEPYAKAKILLEPDLEIKE